MDLGIRFFLVISFLCFLWKLPLWFQIICSWLVMLRLLLRRREWELWVDLRQAILISYYIAIPILFISFFFSAYFLKNNWIILYLKHPYRHFVTVRQNTWKDLPYIIFGYDCRFLTMKPGSLYLYTYFMIILWWVHLLHEYALLFFFYVFWEWGSALVYNSCTS